MLAAWLSLSVTAGSLSQQGLHSIANVGMHETLRFISPTTHETQGRATQPQIQQPDPAKTLFYQQSYFP